MSENVAQIEIQTINNTVSGIETVNSRFKISTKYLKILTKI